MFPAPPSHHRLLATSKTRFDAMKPSSTCLKSAGCHKRMERALIQVSQPPRARRFGWCEVWLCPVYPTLVKTPCGRASSCMCRSSTAIASSCQLDRFPAFDYSRQCLLMLIDCDRASLLLLACTKLSSLRRKHPLSPSSLIVNTHTTKLYNCLLSLGPLP